MSEIIASKNQCIQVSHKTKMMYDLEREGEEAISTRKDALPSRIKKDKEASNKRYTCGKYR